MYKKSKYDTHVAPRFDDISEWAREGATNLEIAKHLGITPPSFYKYMNEHPEFVELLQDARKIADWKVEDSMFTRAIGYKYVEVTKELRDGEMVVVREVYKEQPADTTAMIFWLKNRKPDTWRDRKDVGHSGAIDSKVDLSGLTIKELKKLAMLDDEET